MGVGILAKRVVLELGSSTNFVYSLSQARKIPAPDSFFPHSFYTFLRFFLLPNSTPLTIIDFESFIICYVLCAGRRAVR